MCVLFGILLFVLYKCVCLFLFFFSSLISILCVNVRNAFIKKNEKKKRFALLRIKNDLSILRVGNESQRCLLHNKPKGIFYVFFVFTVFCRFLRLHHRHCRRITIFISPLSSEIRPDKNIHCCLSSVHYRDRFHIQR